MERCGDFHITNTAINAHSFFTHGQEDILAHSQAPIKQVQESNTQIKTSKKKGPYMQKLFLILFLAHLLSIAILVFFLNIRGLLLGHRHHFHPRKWYLPLLTATASGGLVSFIWQWITLCNPSGAIKIAFWVSPLLTCAVGILFVLIGSAASLALGVIAVVFSIIQSLYACWVNPRFNYATRVLSVSTASPPKNTIVMVILSITIATLYSCLLVSGIGGATAVGTKIDLLFISVILISLAWSMQVLKNTLQVTVARIRYIQFVCGAEMEVQVALRDTIKHLMGSVCIGSVIVPVITIIRGLARSIKLIAGDTDEFLFSCANCYSDVASTLVCYGNRWGFVQVGVSSKGFVQASMDTWETIKTAGLEQLINSDLTGVFCFLCGIAGGAICTLVGGTWTLAIHKSYCTEVSIYAFLIGYFMCRIGMAWPQSCVSAYYFAYAENSENPRFDSTIPGRIQELQRYQA